MLFMSFLIMYIVMFLNVNSPDDIFLSLTRLYMVLLMVAPMALLMLIFMPMMYKRKKLNNFIYCASVLIFAISFVCLRNQAMISDEQYMKAMIPHHSSAIMTSANADIQDPEVKALSEKIMKSQQQEIAQMKGILKRMKK